MAIIASPSVGNPTEVILERDSRVLLLTTLSSNAGSRLTLRSFSSMEGMIKLFLN
jgi:hypothetical protein